MTGADYPAAVAAVLAEHRPVGEPGYPGEYYCPACTQAAGDNRAYPCAVVELMTPHLPKTMIMRWMRPRQQCACGHAQHRHAGRACRGVCYECYGESDDGLRDYCRRFRKPVKKAG